MAVITYRDALNQAIREEMRLDPAVFLMGEEVGVYQGAYKVSRGLLDEFGPMRVVDTPITELGFAGVGVGAAMVGLRPIVEFMTWNFALLAIDQVVNTAAKMRYMSGGQISVPSVFRGPGGSALQLAAQHSQAFESWYAHIPGLKVVMPATPADAKGLLKSAIRDDDPVIFFEHKRLYRRIKEDLPEGDFVVPIGKAATRRSGKDLLMVTYGGGLEWTLEAAEILAKEDKVEVEVLDLRSLLPFDLEAILEATRRINRVMIVQEDRLTGGIAAEISARLAEQAFDYLDAPIARVASRDAPMPYHQAMEAYVLPNAQKVVARAREILAY
jgi:pyruvate dehydrogenase E1 component beta subunit